MDSTDLIRIGRRCIFHHDFLERDVGRTDSMLRYPLLDRAIRIPVRGYTGETRVVILETTMQRSFYPTPGTARFSKMWRRSLTGAFGSIPMETSELTIHFNGWRKRRGTASGT